MDLVPPVSLCRAPKSTYTRVRKTEATAPPGGVRPHLGSETEGGIRIRLHSLPLYPEERRCAHPTTEQVLRLFSHAERHRLSRAGRVVQSFEPEFTPLQRQVLDLLGVPASGFRG